MQKEKNIKALILRGDTETLIKLYQDCFPMVRELIIRNSGQVEDAEDVFQEALLVLYKKTREKDFALRCAASTYIYTICRNKWVDRLRNRSRKPGIIDGDEEITDIDDDLLKTIYKSDQHLLYQKHFQSIDEKCQTLLKLFFEGKSMKTITVIMGFGSEQYTRKRKCKCKQKLMINIQNDPIYNELK